MVVDLDDTSACLVDPQCWACETTTDLEVVTLGVLAGVYCLTLCGDCAAAGAFPTDSLTTFARLIRHCAHLDIDLDQMADALDAESSDDLPGCERSGDAASTNPGRTPSRPNH